MSYSQYGKIEAADFNNIVGSSTTSTTGQLNTVWGVGNGNKGYGQTFIPGVAQGNTVSHTDWANLTNTTTSIASHQGTAITNVTAASTGALIQHNVAIPININTVTSNRLSAVAQGTTSSTATAATSWSSQLTFVHTVTFASGDHARYFFNAGGQLALTFSSPSGTGINALMNSLATACGAIVLSAPTSGSVAIAGTAYSGISKTGGSGIPDTLSSNSGYFSLGTVPGVVFKQFASGTPAGYVGSYITVSMNTNGTQGSNGDNGSVITITTVWDEVPNGLIVAVGTTTTLTVRPPRATPTGYLVNTWGTPTVVGSVSGS